MNGCMGIFRTMGSFDAKRGCGEGKLLGMLSGRQAAGGRRSWDWVSSLGMEAVSGYVMPACSGLCLLYNTKGDFV